METRSRIIEDFERFVEDFGLSPGSYTVFKEEIIDLCKAIAKCPPLENDPVRFIIDKTGKHTVIWPRGTAKWDPKTGNAEYEAKEVETDAVD